MTTLSRTDSVRACIVGARTADDARLILNEDWSTSTLSQALSDLAFYRFHAPHTAWLLHLTVTDLFGNQFTVTSDELEDAAYLEQEAADVLAA